MTITLGWWVIPAAMTLAFILWGFMPAPPPRGYGNIADGLVVLISMLGGAIVCLIAWLIWALLA